MFMPCDERDPLVYRGTEDRPGVAYRRPRGEVERLVLESDPGPDLPIEDRTMSNWCERVHPEDRERLRRALDDDEIDVAYRVRGDEEAWITERGTRVENDGTIVGYVFAAGERVERRRRLERQRERLEEFAGVVSHDLRNPLSVAVGNLELARELDGDAADERLERVRDALDRMDALIGDLLALAREGRTVEETAEIDLGIVVDRAWKTVEIVGPAELVVQGELPRMDCDDRRLQRAFENLFRNAIEHAGGARDLPPDGAHDGGPTSVRTSTARNSAARKGDRDPVCITVGALSDGFYVADDGPGIPAEERDRIFEPGHSSAPDGTGFGLSIVERIVAAHGWSIDVRDSRSGGARFEVRGVGPIDHDERADRFSASSRGSSGG